MSTTKEKPAEIRISVCLPPGVHEKVKIAAVKAKLPLMRWVEQAIREALTK